MKGNSAPKLSIITPSYNQALYIEQTIRSVQMQNYAKVEHIIIDGGSSDNTVEILKRHGGLNWLSEKDHGQADALNKGLVRATGDIVGWINSDDYYETHVFQNVMEHFRDPETMWVIGNLSYVYDDSRGTVPEKSPMITFDRLLSNPDIVRQPPTFFRRTFLEHARGWNPNLFMVMDFDLWIRLARITPPKMVDQNWAYFRLHAQQKTSHANLQRQTREIISVLMREKAPWRHIARVYFKKQWHACKGLTREVLSFVGALNSAYRNRPFKINRKRNV
jgi:glycosyltransferase involved in cell wall biosynthesis